MKLLLALSLLFSLTFGGELIMRVDGLACAFCAYGLEKKLKKLKGVKRVEISLNRGIVRLEIDQSFEYTREDLENIVRESGFVLREVRRSGE